VRDCGERRGSVAVPLDLCDLPIPEEMELERLAAAAICWVWPGTEAAKAAR
jgi:hypothetical protein